MFVLSFLYPRPTSRAFDYDYHRDFHMALGIALTKEHLGVIPEKTIIERIDEFNPQSTERYAAIGHVLFSREDDRNKFETLFENEDAARQLTDDWNNYTDTPPEVRISRWTFDDDMQALVDRSNNTGCQQD